MKNIYSCSQVCFLTRMVSLNTASVLFIRITGNVSPGHFSDFWMAPVAEAKFVWQQKANECSLFKRHVIALVIYFVSWGRICLLFVTLILCQGINCIHPLEMLWQVVTNVMTWNIRNVFCLCSQGSTLKSGGSGADFSLKALGWNLTSCCSWQVMSHGGW